MQLSPYITFRSTNSYVVYRVYRVCASPDNSSSRMMLFESPGIIWMVCVVLKNKQNKNVKFFILRVMLALLWRCCCYRGERITFFFYFVVVVVVFICLIKCTKYKRCIRLLASDGGAVHKWRHSILDTFRHHLPHRHAERVTVEPNFLELSNFLDFLIYERSLSIQEKRGRSRGRYETGTSLSNGPRRREGVFVSKPIKKTKPFFWTVPQLTHLASHLLLSSNLYFLDLYEVRESYAIEKLSGTTSSSMKFHKELIH